MHILVTGATGFIGAHLVGRLLATSHEVTLLVREQYGSGHPWPQPMAMHRDRFDAVYADLRNWPQTKRALQRAQPDAIIHLAAVGATDPYLPPATALRHNVNGLIHLIQAAFSAGRRPRFITARTPSERAPATVYAASKAAAWSFARMYAVANQWPIAGAQIFQAFGPGQPRAAVLAAATQAARAGHDFPMTSGRQAKDWIYVADVAEGLLAAVGRDLAPGATFDLGTGRATAVIDVVTRLFTLAGGRGRPRPGLLPDRPGEAPIQIADAASATTLLGWSATTPLDVALRALLDAAS